MSKHDNEKQAGGAVVELTPLMTVDEVAELLQLRPRGVYGLVERRAIPVVRVSNRIRFVRSDIERWLAANRVPARSGR